MMKAIRYEKDAVLFQYGNIRYWLDIQIENEDVICVWNKYIFIITDTNEVTLKKWQENIEHFEDAANVASETLEKQCILYQDDKGKWDQTDKFRTAQDSISLKQANIGL